jgi:hypothetical protein
MLGPFASAFAGVAGEKPAEPPAPSFAQDQARELRDLIQNLQQQVAELKETKEKVKTKGHRRRRTS